MKSPMPSSRRIFSAAALARWSFSILASATLFAIMVLSVVDVFGRYLFNSPVPGTAETIGMAMVLVVFGGLPIATARRDHIVVDLIIEILPRRVRTALFIFSDWICAVTFGVIAFQLFRYGLDLWEFKEMSAVLRIPLAPFAWVISFCSAAAALYFLFVRKRQCDDVSRETS